MPDNDHPNPQLSQATAEQLLQSVVDYAIFMLEYRRQDSELEPRRRAHQRANAFLPSFSGPL